MIFNVEVLLTIAARNDQEADALGEVVVERVRDIFSEPFYGRGGIGYGRVVDATVESVAERRRRLGSSDIDARV